MPTDKSSLPGQQGITLHRSVLVQPQLAVRTSQIEARYEVLEAAHQEGGPVAVGWFLTPGQQFVPTASSVTFGAVFPPENLAAMLGEILTGPVGDWIRNELGGRVACDVDQGWIRRQYAPGNYPRFHSPHGWHQDGALGFDYLSQADGSFPAAALLSMVTCWIALTPCGLEAPGLELVTRRLEGLVAPTELTDERIQARFAMEEFVRPVLAPGDALLFRGDILHRTYVTPAMTKDRTSIELRFFPAENLPARLKADRFIPLIFPNWIPPAGVGGE
jgi:hypothetical protein